MIDFILNWLIVAGAVWGTAQFLPGVKVDSFGSAIGVAALVGVLNTFFGWLLFVVFGIGTLGLAWIFAFITWWVIDAIMIKVADSFMGSFKVDSFGWALAAAAIIAGLSSVGRWILF